ncbi:MAG: hypothetical protein U0610_33130 [bacterium]
MTEPSPPSPRSRLTDPFREGTRLDPRLVGLWVLINAIVLVNALRHAPAINYDGSAHINYLVTLGQQGRLPTPWDTTEFFSPPLPYVVPALAIRVGAEIATALKLAQLFQWLLSMVLTHGVLRLCGRVSSQPVVKLGALGLIALCPVYYKSFAFIRGEPYAACFVVLFLDSTLALLLAERVRLARVATLAALGGAVLLSRQWGAAALGAAACLIGVRSVQRPRRAREWLVAGLLALTLAAQLGGWFYVFLHLRFGSALAFNRGHARELSIANQPASFYGDLALATVFRDPIRPGFPNRLWPLLYTEVWGDYWGYWIVWGRDVAEQRWVSGPELEARTVVPPVPAVLETNRFRVGRYLGRVNAISLAPTVLALVALGAAFARALRFAVARASERTGDDEAARFTLTATIGGTLVGYAWFLLMYPNPDKGDTIKATYLLQIFPLWAVLGGDWLARLHARAPRAARWIAVLLAAVFLHNLPALVTRYAGAG